MERYSVTEEDMKRYYILKKVIEGFLKLKEAAEVLGLSYRQTIRLKKRFLLEGIEGLIRKKPLKPPNLKITEDLKNQIVELRNRLYYDFNILHFKEKLSEVHHIDISYESLRKILIEKGLHIPKRKRKAYRRRRRMPEAGLLVQMDSSQHRWIENIEKLWWLIGMIDDADGYVYAEFHPAETTKANMKVIKDYILQRGVFMALYTDKASHFKTTRHGGVHYNVSLEHKDTQIQRALKRLGIELIHANSPQAKGRIERLFRFFQDRLIKEMRLRDIKDYETANKFLKEEFLPWYNKRYTLSVKNVYKELPKDCNLDLIFSVRDLRKVGKDNTIKYQGVIYQLLPSDGKKSFADLWIEVCEMLNGEIKLIYKDKEISYVVISRDERKRLKEDILNLREYQPDRPKKRHTPSPDHPWRKDFRKKVYDISK